jgi:hypothetical protein
MPILTRRREAPPLVWRVFGRACSASPVARRSAGGRPSAGPRRPGRCRSGVRCCVRPSGRIPAPRSAIWRGTPLAPRRWWPSWRIWSVRPWSRARTARPWRTPSCARPPAMASGSASMPPADAAPCSRCGQEPRLPQQRWCRTCLTQYKLARYWRLRAGAPAADTVTPAPRLAEHPLHRCWQCGTVSWWEWCPDVWRCQLCGLEP